MSSLQGPFGEEEFLARPNLPFHDNYSRPPEGGPHDNLTYPIFGLDNFDFIFDFECGTSSIPALDSTQPQGLSTSHLEQKPPSEPQPASGSMISLQVPNSIDRLPLLYSQASPQPTGSQLNEFLFELSDNVLDVAFLDQLYPSAPGSSTAATPELATPGESSASEPASPGNDDRASSVLPESGLSKPSETEVPSNTDKATDLHSDSPAATAPAAPSNAEDSSQATVASQGIFITLTKADFTAPGSNRHNIASGKRKGTPTPHSDEDSDEAGKRQNTSRSAEEDGTASGAAQSKHKNVPCPWPGCKAKTFHCRSTMNRHYASKHKNVKYFCPGKCGYGPYSRSGSCRRHVLDTPLGSRCRTEALKLGWHLDD